MLLADGSSLHGMQLQDILVEQIASELFDRTRIAIGPNTTRPQGNNATMYYAKLHPRGGTEGNIALIIRIKAAGETAYVQCF